MTARALVTLLTMFGCASSALASGLDAKPWSPERIRELVLRVEQGMDAAAERQSETYRKRVPLPVSGTCHGESLVAVAKRSETVKRVSGLLREPALSCYLTTYLGCSIGDWLGVGLSSDWGPGTKPFTRSKVTIIEQTDARIVADVQEIAFEQVENGIAGDWTATDHPHPYTDKELASYPNTGSRYTISKGADGVWRISDRKPPFAWECKSRY